MSTVCFSEARRIFFSSAMARIYSNCRVFIYNTSLKIIVFLDNRIRKKELVIMLMLKYTINIKNIQYVKTKENPPLCIGGENKKVHNKLCHNCTFLTIKI